MIGVRFLAKDLPASFGAEVTRGTFPIVGFIIENVEGRWMKPPEVSWINQVVPPAKERHCNVDLTIRMKDPMDFVHDLHDPAGEVLDHVRSEDHVEAVLWKWDPMIEIANDLDMGGILRDVEMDHIGIREEIGPEPAAEVKVERLHFFETS